MNRRRFRNHPSSEALARVRWLGWVMIMMFVLVQVAAGDTASGERSEQPKSNISPYVRADAGTLKWPLLELLAGPSIPIPLQASTAPPPVAKALLVSATSGAEGIQPR